MKVALVHDYLREYGGAERVVEVLHEMYPEAPLYTSFVDWQALGTHSERFKNWDIRTSWVQNNWLVKKYHSPLRFLTPLIWESFDLQGYDLVISSSGWYICRGVVTRHETVHISYIHHPPRNLYGYPTGRTQTPLIKLYATIINPFLRMYDYATAQRVDHLVANSCETASRIKKIYRRDATIIYPPVQMLDVRHKISDHRKREYFLSVGRLTYSKRIDLAIEVCNRLRLPLKIVGIGKEESALRKIAGSTIEFLGEVSDERLDTVYSGARALIFSALQEDFGMVPVESLARGVPVIALKQGGVMETVEENKTGLFFQTPTIQALQTTLELFLTKEKQFSPAVCKKSAARFSKEQFVKTMGKFVEDCVKKL